MEHDWRSVSEIAESVASRLAPQVVVASGLMVGISEHHMSHPGSLSLRPATFLAVLTDLISSIARTGITTILVLNGHGGNVEPVRAVWDQILREFQINLQFLPYWEVLDDTDAGILATREIPGHAQEFETAIAAARFPENIRPDAIGDQTDQSPARANAENGRVLFDRIVERVSRHLQNMMAGTSTVRIPPYFP